MRRQEKSEEHLIEIIKFGKCRGCNNPGTEAHVCPFGLEINNDYSTCNCCGECARNCADDI